MSRELFDTTQTILEAVHETSKNVVSLKTLHQSLQVCCFTISALYVPVASYPSIVSDFLQNEQMNRVLYVLTLVTTVVIPGQFLTSLYGMNFVHIPELHYWNGYYYFWAVLLFLTIIIYFVFRRLRLFSI